MVATGIVYCEAGPRELRRLHATVYHVPNLAPRRRALGTNINDKLLTSVQGYMFATHAPDQLV